MELSNNSFTRMIDESTRDRWLELADGTIVYGQPMAEMTRDELLILAVIGWVRAAEQIWRHQPKPELV